MTRFHSLMCPRPRLVYTIGHYKTAVRCLTPGCNAHFSMHTHLITGQEPEKFPEHNSQKQPTQPQPRKQVFL